MYKLSSENAFHSSTLNIAKGLKVTSSVLEYQDEIPDISIGFSVKLNSCHITLKKGGKLVIGDLCELRGRIIIGEDCSVLIGMGLICNDNISIHANEKGTISIADDCLFANPKIYNSDMHSIYDIESGHRINKAKDITIGNRVWIATGCLILKGSLIGDGSIIGAGSVVAGEKKAGSIIAGNPAKEIRSGIAWSRVIMEHPSRLISVDFPVSKFRSMAMQFNHDEVIKMALDTWDRRHLANKNDYFVIYYLCRAIIYRFFRRKGTLEEMVLGVRVEIYEIMIALINCFEISERKNGPCGCYAYLAAQILNDEIKTTEIYNIVKPLCSYIDKDEYKINKNGA
ncbi:acyltransferase [Yersinia intermedia]|uniref:acyltransferase n=1 Tax=Yersinia intermedia TaxID=631 RepID=UPI001F53131A|nr:acyltransferase [Yersinia intermedia]UNK25166.1 acyltransferase [Yersinia intermedia]